MTFGPQDAPGCVEFGGSSHSAGVQSPPSHLGSSASSPLHQAASVLGGGPTRAAPAPPRDLAPWGHFPAVWPAGGVRLPLCILTSPPGGSPTSALAPFTPQTPAPCLALTAPRRLARICPCLPHPSSAPVGCISSSAFLLLSFWTVVFLAFSSSMGAMD